MTKTYKFRLSVALSFVMLSVDGCSIRLPGQPNEAERWRAPSEVSDFNHLYKQNCAGCHGGEGLRGAARSLNDPLYLAFINDAELQRVIAEGRTGTNMPAFSQKSGGTLTDQQIALLVSGMRSLWSRLEDFKGVDFPHYSVNHPATNGASANDESAGSGDAAKGAAAYQTYCSSCHGANGSGGSAGSIVDPNFLTMVSVQGLRTTVVVGRADLGKPDWRSNLPGQPMSAKEIDDVVAWLVSQRRPGKVAATEATLK